MKAMSAYGYEIVQTLIVDIEPDERVKRAMNEINAGMLTCLLLSVFLAKFKLLFVYTCNLERNIYLQ